MLKGFTVHEIHKINDKMVDALFLFLQTRGKATTTLVRTSNGVVSVRIAYVERSDNVDNEPCD